MLSWSGLTSTSGVLIMVLRQAGSAALLVLILAVSLATGAVVVRLAAYMRDESWSRLSAQSAWVRRRELRLLDTRTPGACPACGLRIGTAS
jgi:hypothetical protein